MVECVTAFSAASICYQTCDCVFGDVQLRKFVATQSAGLRVRLHPSLQSEQIGVIPPAGVVSFTSEVPTCVNWQC